MTKVAVHNLKLLIGVIATALLLYAVAKSDTKLQQGSFNWRTFQQPAANFQMGDGPGRQFQQSGIRGMGDGPGRY